MHKDNLPINETTIRRLLAAQTPQWADLPLRPVYSSGTDNALFRLGDELVLRIPRRASAVPLISKELNWLPRLAGLPLRTPTLRHRGTVKPGIDCEFGIFDWMEGDIATPENIADYDEAAAALAGFLKALHAVSIDGAPLAGPINSHRGVPLAEMGDRTLPAIEMVSDEIDAPAAMELWKSAVSEKYMTPPVWVHGDLKSDNLLATDGALTGVIDWGLSAVGDPAADYAAAWSWVFPLSRETFRQALDIDESDWLRAQGWALYGAAIALSYYRGGRNELLCQQCRLTLSRLDLLL